MASIAGQSRFLRALRHLVLVGVIVVAMSACATPGTYTDPYKLVLSAPGLENVQPEVVVTDETFNDIVERSTSNANKATWPKADLTFWRI